VILGQGLEKLGESVPDPARQQKAQEYSKLQRLGSLIELGIGSLLLLVLLFAPASTTLDSLLVFPFLVLQPALNWYNRRIDTAADETALVLSDNP
jgi:Zn-dependent protease with chaperone function